MAMVINVFWFCFEVRLLMRPPRKGKDSLPRKRGIKRGGPRPQVWTFNLELKKDSRKRTRENEDDDFGGQTMCDDPLRCKR